MGATTTFLTVPEKFCGFSRDELARGLALIRNPQGWKLPFRGVIDESEFNLCEAAAIYFASSPLYMIRKPKLPAGKVFVKGPGYYVCVGA